MHFKWKIDTGNNLSPDWVNGSGWQEAPAESGGYHESPAGGRSWGGFPTSCCPPAFALSFCPGSRRAAACEIATIRSRLAPESSQGGRGGKSSAGSGSAGPEQVLVSDGGRYELLYQEYKEAPDGQLQKILPTGRVFPKLTKGAWSLVK